jgi:hypothetical protein
LERFKALLKIKHKRVHCVEVVIWAQISKEKLTWAAKFRYNVISAQQITKHYLLAKSRVQYLIIQLPTNATRVTANGHSSNSVVALTLSVTLVPEHSPFTVSELAARTTIIPMI